jgi:23S rRNA pseudouridine2604 synthase
MTRINKLLSQLGVCSRREADRLIELGKVTINGKKAGLGDQAEISDKIVVDGKPVSNKEIKKIYIAFHKPFGVITTTDPNKNNNVLEYIDMPERVYPIGRLDVESSGLILLTNDGDIVNKLLKSKSKVEKEYIVTVDKPFTPEALKKLASGVFLSHTKILKNKVGVNRRVSMGKFKTLPAKIQKISPTQISITIVQGMNRQVRRMCEVLGFAVKILKRVRIANIHLNELPRGKWRPLTEEEIKGIKESE